MDSDVEAAIDMVASRNKDNECLVDVLIPKIRAALPRGISQDWNWARLKSYLMNRFPCWKTPAGIAISGVAPSKRSPHQPMTRGAGFRD